MRLSSTPLDDLIAAQLERRRAGHLLRGRFVAMPLDATHVQIQGRKFVNFCSNNYLGLANHPRILAAVNGAMRDSGFGSGASALISGHTPLHESAERALARWKRTPAAVLLPSGYQANHAVIQTLTAIAGDSARPIRFLVDKRVHASILDAVFGSRQPVRVFPHNGLPKLQRLLADRADNTLDVVITESIFSMDGDSADLDGLAALKRQHPFILVLDEAHGSGVYGIGGAGYAAERGLHDLADVSVITLSKAMGGIGGAVCASDAFCQAIVNFARAFIYSTSVPAAFAAAAEAAIDLMREEPDRQKRVRQSAKRVREALIRAGMHLPSGDSPIIPIVLGAESDALAAAESLREAGMLVMAVRPPTVPRGSSRLRVVLSSEHTDQEIDALIARLIVPSGKK